MCVVCRVKSAQGGLLRVRFNALMGLLTTDLKATGRSAYACKSGSCLIGLFDRGRLERALKMQIPQTARDELRRAIPAFLPE